MQFDYRLGQQMVGREIEKMGKRENVGGGRSAHKYKYEHHPSGHKKSPGWVDEIFPNESFHPFLTLRWQLHHFTAITENEWTDEKAVIASGYFL